MSLIKKWPECLILAGAIGLVLALAACSALGEVTPASQAALERQAAMQLEYSNAAIEEAAEGNTSGSLAMTLGSILSMLVGTAALSRRRRKSPQNDLETLARVERGQALRAAGVGDTKGPV